MFSFWKQMTPREKIALVYVSLPFIVIFVLCLVLFAKHVRYDYFFSPSGMLVRYDLWRNECEFVLDWVWKGMK